MIKIGITGGIGSGKSTVAKIFETLGVPVYYADDAARRIMNENEALREAIQKEFGQETYINQQLNRPHLASLVFGNEEKLALLNDLVHPLTIEDSQKWMQAQTGPYAIKEAALIFETDVWRGLNKVIGVSSPYELRLQRAMERDNISKEAVLARMSKQMNEYQKMNRCDFILYNDETQLLIPQVITLHEKLALLAG